MSGGFGGGSWGGGSWGGSDPSGPAPFTGSETVTLSEGLTVTLPLLVVSATALTPGLVEVTFSHSLDPSFAANFTASNYSISPSLAVIAAVPGSGPNTVFLATTEQGPTNYTLTVTTGRSIPGDLLQPSSQTANFLGFASLPRFFATAQSKRKVVLIFSTTMSSGPANSNPANYSIQDLNGNAVAITAVDNQVSNQRASLTLGADLTPGGYYVATVNGSVTTSLGLTLTPRSDLFQWASMEAPVTTGPITIPFASFSGEVTSGLLGQPEGLLFFSPALNVAAANSVIQIEEVSMCTRAFDSYEFPQPLDPPILFTFGGPPGNLGPSTVLWAPPDRLGLVAITLSDRHTETMPAAEDGPADATLVEPIDITRAAFLNDVRWHLYDGTATSFITADNLTPIGPGPTVNINLQP